jgi:Tetracyclin repressor-like, C-terminal domain
LPDGGGRAEGGQPNQQAEAMFAVRAPHLAPEQRARKARVSGQLIRALLPLVVAADPAERDAMVIELKAAQRGYLAPIVTEGAVTAPEPAAG